MNSESVLSKKMCEALAIFHSSLMCEAQLFMTSAAKEWLPLVCTDRNVATMLAEYPGRNWSVEHVVVASGAASLHPGALASGRVTVGAKAELISDAPEGEERIKLTCHLHFRFSVDDGKAALEELVAHEAYFPHEHEDGEPKWLAADDIEDTWSYLDDEPDADEPDDEDLDTYSAAARSTRCGKCYRQDDIGGGLCSRCISGD